MNVGAKLRVGADVGIVGAGVGAWLYVGSGLGQFELHPPPHEQHMSPDVKSESS